MCGRTLASCTKSEHRSGLRFMTHKPAKNPHLLDWKRGLLSEQICKPLFINYAVISAYSRHCPASEAVGTLTKALFSLAVLELWHREFVDGQPKAQEANGAVLGIRPAPAVGPPV